MADMVYAGKKNSLFVSPNSNGNFTFRTFARGDDAGGAKVTLSPDALRELRDQINEHLGEEGDLGTASCELNYNAIREAFQDLSAAADALGSCFDV